MSDHQAYSFFIERLANGAWIVGCREGFDDYGRIPADRAGFTTYAEAERHALSVVKRLFRKKRDEWDAKAAQATRADAMKASH